jgi:hypothetical protein
MKIIPIFTSNTSSGEIFSIHFDGEEYCEFDKIFDNWNNPEFLDSFFVQNISDLQSGFFGEIEISEAIYATIEEAGNFEESLLNSEANGTAIGDFFKPLDNYEYQIADHQRYKGRFKGGWLRIYAIKIAPACYIVTGGAIKLTKHMKPSHLQNDLSKLRRVKDFLRDQGIIYSEDLNS